MTHTLRPAGNPAAGEASSAWLQLYRFALAVPALGIIGWANAVALGSAWLRITLGPERRGGNAKHGRAGFA